MLSRFTRQSCGLFLVGLCLCFQQAKAQSVSGDSASESKPIVTVIGRLSIQTEAINPQQSYEGLSAKDRAVLHSQWEQIAQGDEPPYPIDGLQPFSELMRLCLISVLLAKKELISGELIFFVTVDSSGSVVETSLLATPNEHISNLALRFAQDIKFKSAVCGGKPCKMEYPFRFRFDSR